MREKKLALVTGGNRGIGLEVCRQFARMDIRVILTARDPEKGEAACAELCEEGLDVLFHPLDAADPASIEEAAAFVEKKFGKLDILVNNAGVFLDRGRPGIELDITTFRQTMEVNLYGPFLLCQRFLPLIRKNGFGRVVNVSSATSALEGFMGDNRMRGKNAAYRTSKTCLNALTRILADETKGENILVNAASPGRVRTAMTNFEGEKSIEEGADTVIFLATLPDGAPTGSFFRDRKLHNW